MESIKALISTEPVTGFKRVAEHENFVILPDLNMVQQVRVITTDSKGQPLLAEIAKRADISDQQKTVLLARYQDQIITRQTDGAFVDATGKVVDETDEVAISQRSYFQGITIGDLKKMGLPITDTTQFSTLLYALIRQEITNLDNRNAL